MANLKGNPNLRSPAYVGKHSFLPPKSPFHAASPAYVEYASGPCAPAKGIPKPRDGHKQHQRTSSESLLLEEQPSWLDDLLNEPESPVRKGSHRRSSSDSFAYLDASSFSLNLENSTWKEQLYKNATSQPSWRCNEFSKCKDAHYPYQVDANNFRGKHTKGIQTTTSAGINLVKPFKNWDNVSSRPLGPSGSIGESDAVISAAIEMQDHEEVTPNNQSGSSDGREGSHTKNSQPDTDQKRVKQQFAQRSRVRKLQYIAELERNVEALQAEGCEVSAELQFLDQQNLILSLENKTLKQRLDSLAQEHLLKHRDVVQQEMLEREIARLRALCQQQQQPTPTNGRGNGRDLDSRFSSLSLKHKEACSGQDVVSNILRI